MKKNIGIIGTGSLGGMLIRGLIGKGAVVPNQVYIFNRTLPKALEFKEEFPEIHIAENNSEVIEKADWIFICVKPQDLPSLLDEIGTKFPGEKLIVSTLLSPSLSELDNIIQGKIVRIYPSVTQSTGHGVTLIAFNRQVTDSERKQLIALLDHIGKTFSVAEEHFRLCGDITSCGPAFMAYMVGSLARVAHEHGIEKEMADAMAIETMFGTSLLIRNQKLTFDELICRVATPGGCTAEGIKVLEQNLPRIIREIFKVTAAREKEVSEIVLKSLKIK